MSGTTDNIKGNAKEAVGDLTGDKDLQHQGKVDQAAGTIKEKADDLKDWIADKVDDAKDMLKKD